MTSKEWLRLEQDFYPRFVSGGVEEAGKLEPDVKGK